MVASGELKMLRVTLFKASLFEYNKTQSQTNSYQTHIYCLNSFHNLAYKAAYSTSSVNSRKSPFRCFIDLERQLL
jgi:hypothetical protein